MASGKGRNQSARVACDQYYGQQAGCELQRAAGAISRRHVRTCGYDVTAEHHMWMEFLCSLCTWRESHPQCETQLFCDILCEVQLDMCWGNARILCMYLPWQQKQAVTLNIAWNIQYRGNSSAVWPTHRRLTQCTADRVNTNTVMVAMRAIQSCQLYGVRNVVQPTATKFGFFIKMYVLKRSF